MAVLQANLIDPYNQQTGKTRSSGDFIYADDFKIGKLDPVIHVDLNEFGPPVKVNSQTKINFLEEEPHNFIIYYYNTRAHKFTFSDNGLTLQNEPQSMKYLQLIRTTLKANMASFSNFFHKPVFGAIPKPIMTGGNSRFMSFLPFTVFTYRR